MPYHQSPQIKAVHEEYCRLVGTTEREFPMTYPRIFAIDHWIFMGNTIEDLRLVIGHIQRGIKAGKRFAGALKAHNIFDVDKFTEEKVMAKGALRNAKPPPSIKDRYAPTMPTDTAKPVGRVMATSAQITELLKAAHAAADQAQ